MIEIFQKLPGKLIHAANIEIRTIADIIRYGIPDVIIQFGGGLGDEILLTVVAREMKKRCSQIKIWQISKAHELLLQNPDYHKVFDMTHWPIRYSLLLKHRRRHFAYTRFRKHMEACEPPRDHILKILCQRVGIQGSILLRPYIFLSESERNIGRLFDKQISIQCVGIDSYEGAMKNKLWGADNFQKLVFMIKKNLGNEISIIQLGSINDPLLHGVVDLRGKTTLRESAAILSESCCFIGTVGLLMHMARAVDCRSVIIYGGREHASQSGYPCNENLESHIECAPCWLWNECEHDNKCMKMVKVTDVSEAIERVLLKNNLPLETIETNI